MLIALAILALASAAGYRALSTATLRLEKLYDSANAVGDEIIALDILAKDVRSATLEDPSAIFAGRHDGAADRLVFFRKDEGEVEYWAETDAQTGRQNVWRRTGQKKMLLCADAGNFELTYFDGKSWRDEWGWDDETQRPLAGIRGLPLVVSVRLRQSTSTVPVMVALLNHL